MNTFHAGRRGCLIATVVTAMLASTSVATATILIDHFQDSGIGYSISFGHPNGIFDGSSNLTGTMGFPAGNPSGARQMTVTAFNALANQYFYAATGVVTDGVYAFGSASLHSGDPGTQAVLAYTGFPDHEILDVSQGGQNDRFLLAFDGNDQPFTVVADVYGPLGHWTASATVGTSNQANVAIPFVSFAPGSGTVSFDKLTKISFTLNPGGTVPNLDFALTSIVATKIVPEPSGIVLGGTAGAGLLLVVASSRVVSRRRSASGR
ncbi:MAG: hypothetical protein K2Y37_11580 [Pirellulales bacterium]|nr:hypothetical protein [Pirellulales bacterium]